MIIKNEKQEVLIDAAPTLLRPIWVLGLFLAAPIVGLSTFVTDRLKAMVP